MQVNEDSSISLVKREWGLSGCRHSPENAHDHAMFSRIPAVQTSLNRVGQKLARLLRVCEVRDEGRRIQCF
jgi:hypothetical protein